METLISKSTLNLVLPLNASPEEARLAIDILTRVFLSKAATAAGEVQATPVPQATLDATTVVYAAPTTTPVPQSLDLAGLPWDARIHAGTKTKTQKGEWTKRKGVDEATVAAVTAELRQSYPATAPAISTPVAPTAPAISTPVAPTAPAIIPPAPKTPYQLFIDWINRNIASGGPLTSEVVLETVKAGGFAGGIADMAASDSELLDAYKVAFETFIVQQGGSVV